MTFQAFTEEQWRAICSIRDNWPDGIDWLEVRSEIERLGETFWWMRQNRLQFGPPGKFGETLKRLLRQTHKLQDALKALPDRVLADAPDPRLKLLERRLQDWLLLSEMILTRPSFSRRSDAYREWLCAGLLGEWVGRLGGNLSFSRKLDNKPYGPLIDFLTLTLKAILGEAPGPSGIAKIIERYR